MTDQLCDVVGRDVSRETLEKLNVYADLLTAESANQNLISLNTLEDLWSRHIFDSAQIAPFAIKDGSWLDIGSGAGLPGLVLAILNDSPITLCEPRRLRADFLESASNRLSLSNVTVVRMKAASIAGCFDFITARAVASIDKIFAMTRHLTHDGTVYILPKGRSAQSELDEARRSWQGDFRLEPSLTSNDAAILIASSVTPRRKG